MTWFVNKQYFRLAFDRQTATTVQGFSGWQGEKHKDLLRVVNGLLQFHQHKK